MRKRKETTLSTDALTLYVSRLKQTRSNRNQSAPDPGLELGARAQSKRYLWVPGLVWRPHPCASRPHPQRLFMVCSCAHMHDDQNGLRESEDREVPVTHPLLWPECTAPAPQAGLPRPHRAEAGFPLRRCSIASRPPFWLDEGSTGSPVGCRPPGTASAPAQNSAVWGIPRSNHPCPRPGGRKHAQGIPNRVLWQAGRARTAGVVSAFDFLERLLNRQLIKALS